MIAGKRHDWLKKKKKQSDVWIGDFHSIIEEGKHILSDVVHFHGQFNYSVTSGVTNLMRRLDPQNLYYLYLEKADFTFYPVWKDF